MPTWDVHFNISVSNEHPEIVTLVAQCKAMASVINNIPITPSRQNKIDRLNILRAVRGTTGIEGAQLTEDEVRQIMEASHNKPVLPPSRRREEQEARNAEQLMVHVAKLMNQHPNTCLTEELVCKLHKITTKDIDYSHNTPGKYRTHAVICGNYVPPTEADKVNRLMTDFVRWFAQGAPLKWDPIIRAIVAHFYIVSIHPFGDGNGRTSRAVESFLLYKAGINARGFYSLANFYYKNREEYVRQLNGARFETDGNLTPFLLFALRGLHHELQEVHQEVLSEVREISFRDYARERLQEKLATKAGERMLAFLIRLGHESIPIKDIKSGRHPIAHFYTNLTPKTLARDINYLQNEELIIKENGMIKANMRIMDKFTPPYEIVA